MDADEVQTWADAYDESFDDPPQRAYYQKYRDRNGITEDS